MEQNEKNQEIPEWVKIIKDFPEPCQQTIGNLCASVVQNLTTIALFSCELYDAVRNECDHSISDYWRGLESKKDDETI